MMDMGEDSAEDHEQTALSGRQSRASGRSTMPLATTTEIHPSGRAASQIGRVGLRHREDDSADDHLFLSSTSTHRPDHRPALPTPQKTFLHHLSSILHDTWVVLSEYWPYILGFQVVLNPQSLNLVPWLDLMRLKLHSLNVFYVCMNALTHYAEIVGWLVSHVTNVNMFLVQSVVTCGALFWLLHRAWLALWKPVPELISILGIDIPDAPEVSLADIKSDNVTLHWNRPSSNKPVIKYLIQVNGVTVGESSRLETIITVTGLKPGHFYNIRVIAVGANDFQAGSRTIRLSTYNQNGRPSIANGRLPPSFQTEDGTATGAGGDDSAARHGAGIEAAHLPEEIQTMLRESHPGQRRNTGGGRKHSPSVTNELPPIPVDLKETGETMEELTEKFETIRSETEETISQIQRDAEEFKNHMAELYRERDEKKRILKEKEEASEKLRKESHQLERMNRQAQNRKGQKQKALNDKHDEKDKQKQDIERWEKEIAAMKKERDHWEKEKENMANSTRKKVQELQDTLRKRQNSLTGLEEQIRVKGLQVKELEEERKKLAGPDDEETKERDALERQQDLQWDQKERELLARVHNLTLAIRQAEGQLSIAHSTYLNLSSRQAANAPLMYHGNSSGVDFDPTGQSQVKPRRGRNGKSRANTASSASFDQAFSSASGFSGLTATATGFQASPFYGPPDTGLTEIDSGLSEEDIRILTAGAPLSPTASALLPAGILGDEEPSQASRAPGHSIFSAASPSYDMELQQSPASSSRSPSLLSSPRASSHNLSMALNGRDSLHEGDRRSMASLPGAIGSPKSSTDVPAVSRRFGDLFSLGKARGKATADDTEGPALGTLKPGQSQSFPRQDELESIPSKHRRISFSTGWNVPSFLGRSSTGEVSESARPGLNHNAPRRRRGFNMFGSNPDDPGSIYSEHGPSSPRPSSIASSDLPRPSTDSAPFGWPVADNPLHNSSPLGGNNWHLNVNVINPWSRNASRRPSTQHGSSTALATGIATEDDEILPADTLKQRTPPPIGVIGTRPLSSHFADNAPPPNVGVIGSRPPSQRSVVPKLNPAAPTFKAMFGLGPKAEKKGKNRENDIAEDSHRASFDEPLPVSRQSRDTGSICTQDSIADSHESLDQIISNTTSEVTSNSVTSTSKDKENSLQKLLRKGSSSKFSFSSIRTKESLFKKGNNGDRIASGERSSSFGDDSAESPDASLLARSVDSVTSNPSSSLKEGRMGVNWGRFSIKKGKNTRESLDTSRTSEEVFVEDDEA